MTNKEQREEWDAMVPKTSNIKGWFLWELMEMYPALKISELESIQYSYRDLEDLWIRAMEYINDK